MGLNVMLANAAQVSVSLDQKTHCVDALQGSVILKSTALASLLTVQRIFTARMDLHVTITRATATWESAKLMMHSARSTLKLVCVLNDNHIM